MDATRVSRRKRFLLYGIVALLAALACNEHGLIAIDEAITVERQDVTVQTETNKIDILWVIDDSNSMNQEQAALIANFDAFIVGLAGINADFRIAVTSTDMVEDNGRFQSAPGSECSSTNQCPDGTVCVPSYPGNRGACLATANTPPPCPEVTGPVISSLDYLLDPDDPQSDLDVEALRRDFGCIANVGVRGSGFEKGLDAMAAALAPEMIETVNVGFRREDAWLAIVFVADENDCSEGGAIPDMVDSFDCEALRDNLTPVDLFVDFVMNLPGAADGDRVLVAAIIGPDNGARPTDRDDLRPSCTSPSTGDAYAGYRYQQFVAAFGERGVTASICTADFSVALNEIARVIRENLAIKCLRTQPRTCETEADCAPGVACQDPDGDGVGLQLCADFDLEVESRTEGVEEWTVLPGPEESAPAYTVNYSADNCPTGIGVEFTPGNEPGAGVEFRIRYPIVLGGNDTTPDGTGSTAQ